MRGHVRRRGRRSWAVVLDLGRDSSGKRRQKWHTVQGTKRDAERELGRLLNELNVGAYVEPTRMLLRDYFERWLEHTDTRVSGKTQERYEEIVRKHLVPAIGHHHLAKLQPLHIQDYYTQALRSDRLRGKGTLSAQTVLHHHRVLHSALRQAVQWLLLARNPADAVEAPRPKRKQVPALTEDEALALLAHLEGTRFHGPALLALSTGLRRGELMALRWRDVDFEGRSITVCRSFQQTKQGVAAKEPKSGRGRVVALPEVAVTCLRTLRADQARRRLSMGPAYIDNGLVFARLDGSIWPPNSFTSGFAAAVRSSPVRGTSFHALRHTHATTLLRRGINPKVVSERLGHARVGTTLDIYSHVLPGMQEEAARRIDAAFGSPNQH